MSPQCLILNDRYQSIKEILFFKMNWVALVTGPLRAAFVMVCVICLMLAQDTPRRNRDSWNMPSECLLLWIIFIYFISGRTTALTGISETVFCLASVSLSDAVVLIPVLRSLVITMTTDNLYLHWICVKHYSKHFKEQ